MKVATSGLRQDSPSKPLLQALISYQGITDAVGAATGLTIVCGDLVNEPSYDGLLCKIRSGPAAGQVKPIYVQAGNTLTFATPWTNAAGAVQQITAGTLFDILSISAGGGGPGPAPKEGLSYYGVVDDVPGANQFTIGSLAGLGAGKFADAVNPYVVFVLRSAGGIGGAPQGELLPVTAYATATGIFTTAAFTVAVGVGDEILIIHPAIAATLGGGGGVAVAGYPDGIVYFNDTDGAAGVAWPVGTADNPSNDEASTLAIAVAYGLRKISVYGRAGAFVVPGAMVGYEFTGQGMYSAMDTIDLNGQDVATSVFRRLNIIGAMGGVAALASFYDCTMPTPTNIDGILQRCYIQQMGLAAAAVVDADGCCASQGPATITLGTPAPCNLYGWKGDLVLAGQTGGTTNIYALGGTITINVSCNGGTINIYGTAIVIDNSAVGCTVNDYTINMVPGADAATNVQLRDVIGNKTDTALYAPTAADSLVRYIKGLLGSMGNPSGDTLVSLAAKLGDPTDDLDTRMGRMLFSMDFWSLPQKTVVVPIAAADQALPDITVADLPAGAAVVRVQVMFKFRSLSNAGAANKLTNAQEIQIRTDAPGAWTDAINLVDDQFLIAAAAVDSPGDVVMGLINVAATVTGNDTYNLQWDEAIADVAGLTFNDVQVGLKIWYSV